VLGVYTLICIVGYVASGVGEGSKYVSMYMDFIEKAIGERPYPGTLNIVVHPAFRRYIERLLMSKPFRVIPPPSEGLCEAYVWRAKLLGDIVYVVRPRKTVHPPSVLEILSKHFLRGRHRLRDGDAVELCIEI